jgi:uncharacterized OB-fold protein
MISPVKTWRRQKYVRHLLNKTGKVLTWTFVYTTSKEFKKYAPYPVVLVEFEDGERSFGQLVDYTEKDLKIGIKVVSVLRKIRETTDEGIINYGMKFKPL